MINLRKQLGLQGAQDLLGQAKTQELLIEIGKYENEDLSSPSPTNCPQ